jgi:hypothetical protein
MEFTFCLLKQTVFHNQYSNEYKVYSNATNG